MDENKAEWIPSGWAFNLVTRVATAPGSNPEYPLADHSERKRLLGSRWSYSFLDRDQVDVLRRLGLCDDRGHIQAAPMMVRFVKAGYDPELLRKLRLREVLVLAEEVAGDARTPPLPPNDDTVAVVAKPSDIGPMYPCKLREALGCKQDTLSKYAKAADVPKRGPGGGRKPYSAEDVVKILRYASERGGDSTIRDNARALLSEAEVNPK